MDSVWNAFTTSAGIESWMAAHATFDLRIGGTMQTVYAPEGKLGEGDQGSRGQHGIWGHADAASRAGPAMIALQGLVLLIAVALAGFGRKVSTNGWLA